MVENNKTFRIKYDQLNPVDHINVKLDQDFDLLEVLSLSISQEDVYRMYTSEYGVVVGRVLANDGFGIPNAKISIFISNKSTNQAIDKNILYPFNTTADKNSDGIRYNLLPDKKVNKCHQNVGSLPSKRDILDNNIKLDTFNDFYKYTTITNESGDYMFFGIPTGSQQIHVDIDLSDIGVLSQAPRDMEYKGYNIKQFDSPNKFKTSTNLDSLPQIISQDTTIFVYPFWGDESQSELAITKKTINIQYKFEPTCVFMGSIFTDSQKSSISKTCRPDTTTGVMSELTTSQGSIEMIRKTINDEIELFDINGGRLINNDGVWCYQIPMNLDYVVTDEFGNLVPTTDPTKGIPTSAKVRFRITLDDNGDDFVQSKTGVYLIPNKPKSELYDDYEFSSNCKEFSFVNLMWNKVYSVKNYIPRTGKSAFLKDISADRHFTGLKSVNYHGNNNPAPYNNIWVNINLRFMLICLLTTFFIKTVGYINYIITLINHNVPLIVMGFLALDVKLAGDVCSTIDWKGKSLFVPFSKIHKWMYGDEEAATNSIYGIDNWFKGDGIDGSGGPGISNNTLIGNIISCVETQLSSENEVVNFDFTNDWINGSLYAPRFLTKTKKNRKTGKQDPVYCGSWVQKYTNLFLVQSCAPSISKDGIINVDTTINCNDKQNCYKKKSIDQIYRGTINRNEVDDIFYYRAVEFPGNKYLYSTDIILLGSLLDCDQDGIPQLHQLLPSTSFKLPPDSFEPDGDYTDVKENSPSIQKEMSGIDWGNTPGYEINGLFVGVSCMDSNTIVKSCVNATRLCEIGVDFDEKHVGSTSDGYDLVKLIDGYISTDEITDGDVRGMFSTLNINNLSTSVNSFNQPKYDFIYNYPNGFDGKLRSVFAQDGFILDYYTFRFGTDNLNGNYYTGDYSFPRYENSFYFYFGIKPGSTAIDLFNNQYFVPCSTIEKEKFTLNLIVKTKEGICEIENGILSVKTSKAVYPYDVYLDDVMCSSNISSDNEILIDGLKSKYYSIKVIDGNNNIVVKSIFLPKNIGISYKYLIKNTTTIDSNKGELLITDILNDNSSNTSNSYKLYKNGVLLFSGVISTNTLAITDLGVGLYVIMIYEIGCATNIKQYTFNINYLYTSQFINYFIETKLPDSGYNAEFINYVAELEESN